MSAYRPKAVVTGGLRELRILGTSGHWTTAVAGKRILALFTTRHLLLFS